MAAFASWGRITRAYSRKGSDLYLNAGLQPSELTGQIHQELDESQIREVPPWSQSRTGGSRYDRFTFGHAFAFLKEHHPRFLSILLLDPDEYAHRGDYPNYIKALEACDTWIREISDYLNASGDYGRNTLLIVTTDHGRGNGEKWREHGRSLPESRNIWLYLRGPGFTSTQPTLPGVTLNHDSIRTLIEAFFKGAKPEDALK
jgi:hypothetical protein